MQSFSLLGGLDQLPKAGFPTATQFAPIVQAAALPEPGTCTADGLFIWTRAADGTGYWRRRQVNEACTSTSSYTVESGGAPGGRTITEAPTYRTFKHKAQQLVKDRANRDAKAYIALAPSLPPCPASSADGPGGQCYYRSPPPSLATMLMPPGSWEYLGVPFHASEMAPEGFFQKSFVPDEETQFLIQWAIVEKSGEILRPSKDHSIEEALRKYPDLRVKMDGWIINPIEPTAEEWRNPGGYGKWIDRGGFGVSLPVATGQIPIASKIGIPVCASIKCACPQDSANYQSWRDAGIIDPDQQVHMVPRCIGGVMNKEGIQTGVSTLSNSWDVYASAIPGQYVMKITHNDPSALEKFAAEMAKALRALIEMFCGNQQPIKDEIAKSSQENCITKDQKPCAKGTAGCTCTPPSEATKQNVTSFNIWATTSCAAWGAAQAMQTQPPNYEAPTIPEVPQAIVKKPFPWGIALAGGAVAIGVVAFLLRP